MIMLVDQNGDLLSAGAGQSSKCKIRAHTPGPKGEKGSLALKATQASVARAETGEPGTRTAHPHWWVPGTGLGIAQAKFRCGVSVVPRAQPRLSLCERQHRPREPRPNS